MHQVGQIAFNRPDVEKQPPGEKQQPAVDQRQKLAKHAKEINDYAELPDAPVLTIEAGHSGDMYDVALAFKILKGNATIVIWGVNKDKLKKAADMAEFFGGNGLVFCTTMPLPPKGGLELGNKQLAQLVEDPRRCKYAPINEGKATTIVALHAKELRPDERQNIGDLIAPENLGIDGKILDDLKRNGFKQGVPYIIVNFRKSGHSGAGTAPALDTGTAGMQQLLTAAQERGTPVPMGEYVPPGMKFEANLTDYFNWPSCAGLGRAAEARVLRVLAKTFTIRGAVAMRSGVTDLLMYMGIPTLSIDIHPSRGKASKGWQRSFKRSVAFGKQYQRHYLMQGREDEIPSAESKSNPDWGGKFGKQDLKGIKGSLAYLVGPGEEPWNNDPLNPDDLAHYVAEVSTRVEKIPDIEEAEMIAQELDETIQMLQNKTWFPQQGKLAKPIKALEGTLDRLRIKWK